MKRLTRRLDNKMIAGVCSGLAAYFNVDVTLVRLCTVGLAVCTVVGIPAMLLMYLIAVIMIPVEG